ncbi:MAG: L-arabinose isomerase [Ignavibacteriae bacterium]|nr:L-arabinose isomerase [Ignavibacteriota bacterium]
MIDLKQYEIWFLTGSQHLYGPDTLRSVAEHSELIVKELAQSEQIPVRVVFKPVLTTPDAIFTVCLEANNTHSCVGVVAWMHTFSPAKMWIGGLKALNKPLLDLHTQFGRDIPWGEIDMDFMNLNQTAHGGREFGFITARMKKPRKVVVGFWQDVKVQQKIGLWARAAAAWADGQGMKVARFGDNMRNVAVTEGDKVEAELRFGYAVNGYGVGDLVAVMRTVTDAEIDSLLSEYENRYELVATLRVGGAKRQSLRDAARIELGIRAFLKNGNCKAFTTTFEDLHGLEQLPGLSVQRLMADGYGFGAEGDWKTAALLRAVKVMASGLYGGTSFMEDYTYHLDPAGALVLGAHMLEICESIAATKPRLEIHPLSIGGKADPPRLVFDVAAGNAINATLVDMGNRFRLIVNEVATVAPPEPLPKLPVARALWIPKPDFDTAVAAWILAGGAHHTVFSQSVPTECLEDYAEIAGVELLVIDDRTSLAEFKKELRWNDACFRV